MRILLTPTIFICSIISCLAPLPIASMAITAATPKMIPRAVSIDFSLFETIDSTAISMSWKYRKINLNIFSLFYFYLLTVVSCVGCCVRLILLPRPCCLVARLSGSLLSGCLVPCCPPFCSRICLNLLIAAVSIWPPCCIWFLMFWNCSLISGVISPPNPPLPPKLLRCDCSLALRSASFFAFSFSLITVISSWPRSLLNFSGSSGVFRYNTVPGSMPCSTITLFSFDSPRTTICSGPVLHINKRNTVCSCLHTFQWYVSNIRNALGKDLVAGSH